jgi:phospholipid/cholesterol/gamma-HCH transport system substrate-binding protein
MPRTRSLAWAELKIGLVTIFAIVMTLLLVFLLGGEGGLFADTYNVKTVFPNVAGLKPGAPVRLAGMEIGTVEATDLVGEQVEVTMELPTERQPLITTRSVATLGSVSLLGEGAVDITASDQGTPIPEWGYVPSGRAVGSINDVAVQATEGIEQLTQVLADIRAGRGTVGQLFTNDALYRELNGLVAAAEEVAGNVNAGRGTLGRLVNDPAAARSLETALANLESVTASIRAGQGSIGRLLNDDAMARSLTATTASVDSITSRINKGEGTAGALINDRALYDRLNSMANRVDQVVASLQKGEGTAGQLLQDRQLYENMNSTMAEVRKLIAAITADPRKYLTVRVSIF